MKTLTTDALVTVTGGTKANDAVTQQLTQLGSSIKDLAANQNNNKQDPMAMMMMMMAMRPQQAQAVVAAPAPASPVVNIDTRVRR